MRRLVLLLVWLGTALVPASFGQSIDGPLVRFDSTKWPGTDPAFDIKVNELERNETTHTSKVQVIRKKGGPTGSALISTKGIYEIAKARHAAYFVTLKSWTDPDGSWMSIVGFPAEKNPDFKTAFGEPYSETQEDGGKRITMSVADAARVFEGDNTLGQVVIPVPTKAPTSQP
ncbi:hypothetical protein SAMN05444156_0695 [Verrucomicrobium sp. GAS474]|uniref:hypothetical protein n=1 Tax=Verrucomicrobium sp. GAS474 TaxID=1882831 RepID=UPI00087A7466|nr:hypothetical protein [Verrucomicrobium sp. GAS474]SDT91452.1 hypothetical protein SAMN05444156_0695 [Verrucomicrobium sp. GAS474]